MTNLENELSSRFSIEDSKDGVVRPLQNNEMRIALGEKGSREMQNADPWQMGMKKGHDSDPNEK